MNPRGSDILARPAPQPYRRRRPRCGVGLIEAAVATVIVGVMLVSAFATFDATMRAGNVTANRRASSSLASTLMNEALRAHYEEPTDAVAFGLEPGEAAASRAAWDDLDDYNGLMESPPRYADGTEIISARKWAWQASVALVDLADPNRSAAADAGLKRITITVIDPKGVPTTLVALRSRMNPRDRAVTAPTSFVGHVAVRLEIGGGIKGDVSSGATLLNEPAP